MKTRFGKPDIPFVRPSRRFSYEKNETWLSLYLSFGWEKEQEG